MISDKEFDDLSRRYNDIDSRLVTDVDSCRLIEYANYLRQQLADLQAWKDEAMSLMSKLAMQEIGAELGVPLGHSITEAVLPGIRRLKQQLAEAHRAALSGPIVKLRERIMADTQRDILAAEAAALQRAATHTAMMHMFVKVGPPPQLEYLGFDHVKAAEHIRALLTAPQKSALAEHDEQVIERVHREYLWGSHGHLRIYGDDGEMQCSECGVDYKRDSFPIVAAAAAKAKKQAEAKRLREARIEELQGVPQADSVATVYICQRLAALAAEKAVK